MKTLVKGSSACLIGLVIAGSASAQNSGTSPLPILASTYYSWMSPEVTDVVCALKSDPP